MKTKKIFTGWAHKDLLNIEWDRDGMCQVPTLFKKKGEQYMWPISSWPPKKIKITVEVL